MTGRPLAVPIVLTLLSVGLPFAARLFLGPPGAIVHIRWLAAVDEDTRARLENEWGLRDRDWLGEGTWRYNLIDVSSANIRAIVGHRSVEDTHHIDRRRYSVAASATRTPRQPRIGVNSDNAVRIVDVTSLAFVPTAIWFFLRAAAKRESASRLGALAVACSRLGVISVGVVRVLARGIPETTAATAGAFRVVFGTLVVWFFLSHPESASSIDNAFNPLIEGELHAMVIEWMRRHSYVVDALIPWLLITGAAFTVGAFTRLTYALFVGGALAWLFVATTHDSTHPHGVLGLALVALLPSRWGDALSVDAWRRSRTHHWAATPSQAYGYSTWAPTLVFGIAFAAAAWAKLSRTPGWGDWILNGSVKYHFITDAHNAPVDWGLQLAGHPSLAVLASFAAVATESLVITAAFARNEWYRLAMGAAAMSLLAGFWLFMGVFWPGWWILLLGFLPWRRIALVRSVRLEADPGGSARVLWAQLAMVVLLIGQQIAFSAQRIERSPMFTYYPMYSSTFASSDEFDATMVPYYRIVVSTAEGNVELSCDAPENLVEEFRMALQGSQDASARVWRAVNGCNRNLRAAKQVMLEGDRHVFDWQALKFKTTRAAVVLGPISAATTPSSARD